MHSFRVALSNSITRLAAGVALPVLLAACGQSSGSFQMPPPEVGTLQVQAQPVELSLEYPAQLRGIREVEVRARVSGILLERRYREGQFVKEGDLLFRIDPAPFRAEVARAQAEVGVRQAALQQATREHDRILKLYEQRLVSLRERDAAIAAFESAQAAAKAAEAQLERTRLDLSYTEVRAPIDGLTSREARSEGSLVTAGAETSLLTHIVQADRLYVEFAMPEADSSSLRAALDGKDANAVRVHLADTTGAPLGEAARVEFIAPRVGDETGTVAVRAVLENKNGALWPGQVVRARIEGVQLPPSIVIPKRAVMRGMQGTFVWLVNGEGKVEPRPVQLGTANGNSVIVTQGLNAGEQVVVDGVLKVQPGAAVKAVAAQAESGASAAQAGAGAGTGAGG